MAVICVPSMSMLVLDTTVLRTKERIWKPVMSKLVTENSCIWPALTMTVRQRLPWPF